MGAACCSEAKPAQPENKRHDKPHKSNPTTKMPGSDKEKPTTQDADAEAQNENPLPAAQKMEQSKEPEATPDVTPKKPLRRIIKPPVEPDDPTLYLKTYTGDEE